MSASTRSLNHWLKLAIAPLLLIGLAACAQNFNANVSRFQAELPAPAGQSFAVVADDPALAGGIEFGQYAGLVSAQMTKLGYVAAADPASADLIVRFDYGVDKGRERVRSAPMARDPFWSPWYGYGRMGYGGFGYAPGYGGYGSRGGLYGHGMWGYGWYDPWLNDSSESYTVYTSGLNLKIDRRADGHRLFEGKAEAASTSSRLPYLVPNLVEAMFTDVPGHNGDTVRISVAPEKKRK